MGIAAESQLNRSLRPNSQFGPVLTTIRPSEASNRPEVAIIDQEERNCIPTGQYQVIHTDNDSPEAPEGWLVGRLL